MNMSFLRFFLLLFFLKTVPGVGQSPSPEITDTVAARVLFRESVVLTDSEQYTAAMQRLKEATRMLEQANARESDLYATVLHQTGNVYLQSRRPDSAIVFYTAAIALRERLFGYNHELVAACLMNIASAYEAKFRFPQALEYNAKALAILKALPGGREAEIAKVYNNTGNVYVRMQNLPRAMAYADSALSIRENLLPSDTANLALSCNNIGSLHCLSGNFERAVEYLERALELRESVYGPEHRETTATLCNLGAALYFTGDNEHSLKLLQKALDIRRRILPSDDMELAESYANLMLPLIPLGDPDLAIAYGQQALAIGKKNGLHGMAITGNVELAWGSALVCKGLYTEAIQHLESALGYFALMGNMALAAEALNNIGAACGAMGDYKQQKRYLQKSLDHKLRLQPEHPAVAIGYVNLGLAYQNAGQADSAAITFDKALEHLSRTAGPKSPYLVTLFNARARLKAGIGDFDGAFADLDAAKTINGYEQPGRFQSVGHLDNLLTTLAEAGEFWRSRSDELPHLQKAREGFLEAWTCAEHLRTAPLEAGSKAALNQRIFPLLEALIATDWAIFCKTGDQSLWTEAFRFSEALKSFNLYLAFHNSGAHQFAHIPADILMQEQSQRETLSQIQKKRTALENARQPDPRAAEELQSAWLRENEAFRQFRELLRDQYPEYYQLQYTYIPETPETTRQGLLPNQAMLEYFSGDSSLYLFVIRSDTFIVREVKRDFPLDNWVDSLRQGLYGFYTAEKPGQTDLYYESALNRYLEYAPKLYDKLIAPVAQWLPENVLLIPDGPLHYIPFDALLDSVPQDPNNFKAYPYLLRKYCFAYAYSATLLWEMRDKKHRHEPSRELIAFAPFYNGDATQIKSGSSGMLMQKDRSLLPYSGPEVVAAAALMKGEIIQGAAATSARFTRDAGAGRILHLATHGKADNRVGDYAYLVFAKSSDSLENELLYVKDLYNMELNADLVVLSACETGIGKLQRGEGILSLARAFAYAGAKSMVTSLWPVNNQSTSELMRNFYNELHRGEDKGQSLRQARLRYLEEADVSVCHPFFWAAFVPVGDMKAVR